LPKLELQNLHYIILKKITSIFLLFLLLTNCSTSPENEYYTQDKKLSKLEFFEYMTKIKFPETSRLVTGIDSNSSTIAVVKFHKSFCSQFYKENKFQTIKDTFAQTLLGQHYLDSNYRQLPDNTKLLRRRGKGNGTLWMILLDTTTCELYCNFSYPDINGYTKPIWVDPFQETLSPDKEKFAKQ
jgi:hypothetical protein